MRRRGYNPHEGPGKRTERAKPGPVPTLGSIRRNACWVWLYCRSCGRGVPAALTPFIIRWGADVSSDVLRRSAHCKACGGKGATLMHPSWQDEQVGQSPFPVEQMA
jgi:hypothetical protein